MKKLLFVLFAIVALNANAQTARRNGGDDSQIGKITLNPYIVPDAAIGESTKKVLTDKLNQVVTMNGCAGEGWESRFIITANLVPIEESTTATVPVMTAVELGVTIYVGDGQDGTLFSSWYTEVKGVGDSRDAAWKAAIKKISPKNPELVASIEKGKSKVAAYFASAGPSIIAKAKSAAQGHNINEAIAILVTIPSICPQYEQAQALIGEYTETAVDNANFDIISKARAAWAASPDESGAAKAESILNSLDSPSAKVRAQAKALTTEITSRLKTVSDRQFAFEKQQAAWEHQETINRQNNATKLAITQSNNYTKRYVATTRAAARIATAYYNSRPRVVHHVHWW